MEAMTGLDGAGDLGVPGGVRLRGRVGVGGLTAPGRASWEGAAVSEASSPVQASLLPVGAGDRPPGGREKAEGAEETGVAREAGCNRVAGALRVAGQRVVDAGPQVGREG